MQTPRTTPESDLPLCVITGATSGIGRALALTLAARNLRLILIGRNAAAGNAIAEKINTARATGRAAFIRADLSCFEEVRGAAAQIKSRCPRVDILVNNAGARFNTLQKNPGGIELTFAANHLGHFLLTNLLLEALAKPPGGRIITVASDVHRACAADFDYVAGGNAASYDRKAAYGKSKLANLLFTYELARRLAGTAATANAVHPGGVATNLGRNNGLISWLRHYVYYIMKRQLITPAQAAGEIAYLALSDDVRGVTGKYFYKKQQIRSSNASYDREAQQKLWELSLRLCGPAG